jgi:hypothetical protein
MRLFRVLAFSLPFLFRILLVFLIIQCVYASFGCRFFGHLHHGEVLDDYVNFDNFWHASLALFKCASGDHWRFMMTDCTPLNPHCPDCSFALAYTYYFSFFFLQNFITLNLFILGLVEQLEGFLILIQK